MKITTAIKIMGGTLGALCGWLFGEVSGLLIALIVIMACDYITGVIYAATQHALSSQIGFAGLCKKFSVLIVVIVGHMIDMHILGGGAVVRDAVICFYFANEGLSIIENLGNIGVPLPKKIRMILKQLKEDSDNDDI